MALTSQSTESMNYRRRSGDDSAAGRILLIEDDPDIATVIRIHLEDAQYEVTVAADGRRGLEAALCDPRDLFILDLTLPGMDGLEICERVATQVPRPATIPLVTAI